MDNCKNIAYARNDEETSVQGNWGHTTQAGADLSRGHWAVLVQMVKTQWAQNFI